MLENPEREFVASTYRDESSTQSIIVVWEIQILPTSRNLRKSNLLLFNDDNINATLSQSERWIIVAKNFNALKYRLGSLGLFLSQIALIFDWSLLVIYIRALSSQTTTTFEHVGARLLSGKMSSIILITSSAVIFGDELNLCLSLGMAFTDLKSPKRLKANRPYGILNFRSNLREFSGI